MWTRKMNFLLLISGRCITVMQKNSYHTSCGLPLWLYLAVSMAELVSFKICEGHSTWVPSQAKVPSPAHNGSTFSLKSISWAATHAQKTGHEGVSWKKWIAWRFVCCIITVHIPIVRCTWHLTRGNTTYKIPAYLIPDTRHRTKKNTWVSMTLYDMTHCPEQHMYLSALHFRAACKRKFCGWVLTASLCGHWALWSM